MSANELRQAAETLHAKVAATRPGPWEAYPDGLVWDMQKRPGDPISGSTEPDDADYIATMHPGIGLALADWLEAIAISWVWDEHPDDVETPDGWPLTLEESIDTIPLKIARLINGGPA